MIEKKDKERVIAEITLSHRIRLANEQGWPVYLAVDVAKAEYATRERARRVAA